MDVTTPTQPEHRRSRRGRQRAGNPTGTLPATRRTPERVSATSQPPGHPGRLRRCRVGAVLLTWPLARAQTARRLGGWRKGVPLFGDDVTAASMTHSASGHRRLNRSSRARSASQSTHRVRFLRAWAVPVYSVAVLNRRSTSLRGIMIRPYWVIALKVPL